MEDGVLGVVMEVSGESTELRNRLGMEILRSWGLGTELSEWN
jgi:hypothetical protein